ncbi:hypothetical protein Ancab_005144, partial [Ancistrocladus abbreviatus]
GTLISLDKATSSKSRFDVARLLISTSIPETISAKLPILAEEKRFLVYVFEETLGETIFSRGSDRTRVGNKARGDIIGEGKYSSTVPCTCTNTKSYTRSTSPEYLSDNGKIVASKSPVFNDDGHNNPSGYKSSHVNVTAGQFSGKCWATDNSSVGYVSSIGKQAAGALMEDKTTLIKMREDLETTGSKLAQINPLQAKLDLLDHRLEARQGLILNDPH